MEITLSDVRLSWFCLSTSNGITLIGKEQVKDIKVFAEQTLN